MTSVQVPASGVILGGLDIAAFGVVVTSDLATWSSTPAVRVPTTTVPGRAGTVETGPGEVEERVLRLAGTQRATTPAELADLWRRWVAHLSGRSITAALATSPGLAYYGRVHGSLGQAQPQARLSRPDRQVELEIRCRDPYAYALQETVVPLSPAGASLPVGTAPVRPVVVLGGAQDPVLIYRDAAGVERGRMTLAGSIPAGSPVTIDCARQTIRRANGAPHGLRLSGTFLRVDPGHAVGLDGPFPTLSVFPAPSAMAVARYRLAWMSL